MTVCSSTRCTCIGGSAAGALGGEPWIQETARSPSIGPPSKPTHPPLSVPAPMLEHPQTRHVVRLQAPAPPRELREGAGIRTAKGGTSPQFAESGNKPSRLSFSEFFR